jgi:hypothetical protein
MINNKRIDYKKTNRLTVIFEIRMFVIIYLKREFAKQYIMHIHRNNLLRNFNNFTYTYINKLTLS